jgi:hypothetical protein
VCELQGRWIEAPGLPALVLPVGFRPTTLLLILVATKKPFYFWQFFCGR